MVVGPSRPRIAVTGPDRGGLVPWLMTATALRRAGAVPVRVTPRRPRPERGDGFDAVVLGGGSDVDARLYGEPRRAMPYRRLARRRYQLARLRRWLTFPAWIVLLLFKRALSIGALEVDPERDRMELELLERTLERDRPVLGICRGCQLINVHFGGDLHQDLRGYDLNPSKVDSVFPRKPIRIARDSLLSAMLGTEECLVNSLHNQAVRNPGRGLRICAHDRDGIVQGIEHRELAFLVGVQWHPEYLPQKRRQRHLFHELVKAVHDRWNRKEPGS